jgi:uncharacterized protein YrrD
MRQRLENLIGFTIGATDGEVGKVKEFYFDDKTWTIRYLVVETGSWLFGRKILLSPEALLTPNWDKQIFPVNLTMEQIKCSPEIDTDIPVSRQQEMELHGYYSWSTYWGGGLMGGGIGTSGMMIQSTLPLQQAIHNEANSDGKENHEDPHLRSTDKVKGYTIQATDSEIGEVEDFIIDNQTWAIDFMEVDTGKWFPGKKVLISPKWIREINWKTSSVIVNATKEQVKNSPEYFPNHEISDSYVSNLEDYYKESLTH